jgi:Ni2+-binding GTPase involved in maturation of urease and hydrogenase
MRTWANDQTSESDHPPKARYIMVGGFLGAGKTTTVGWLARRLSRDGSRVGLITNDQGRNLVDTAMLRSQGFATEEIPGGCFCCRFNSLMEAAEQLTASSRPEVFIAEPVGSCTDLAATVTYPLRRMYGDGFIVAPVSVLVDPVRGLRMFDLEPGGTFSEKVRYIYLKQIEEADLVVISKCDLVNDERLDRLRGAILHRFPNKEILPISVRAELNLEPWLERIVHTEQVARAAMIVDYEIYAEGEALLGWLNCTIQLSAQTAFEAEPFLKDFAADIQSRLRAANAEVAHLKMTLSPDAPLGGAIAAINLVRNDFVPELSFHLEEPVTGGQLIVNLRAEAPPEELDTLVRDALAVSGQMVPTLRASIEHLEQFRPGKPTPTHRIAALDH